jgi:hypothetical protein
MIAWFDEDMEACGKWKRLVKQLAMTWMVRVMCDSTTTTYRHNEVGHGMDTEVPTLKLRGQRYNDYLVHYDMAT